MVIYVNKFWFKILMESFLVYWVHVLDRYASLGIWPFWLLQRVFTEVIIAVYFFCNIATITCFKDIKRLLSENLRETISLNIFTWLLGFIPLSKSAFSQWSCLVGLTSPSQTLSEGYMSALLLRVPPLDVDGDCLTLTLAGSLRYVFTGDPSLAISTVTSDLTRLHVRCNRDI